jgi:hypothetical protein
VLPPAVRKGLPFRHRPEKKNDVISLSDAFVSKIANQDGLRSMPETALTRGHLRNCQPVRSSHLAYGVRTNPWKAFDASSKNPTMTPNAFIPVGSVNWTPTTG